MHQSLIEQALPYLADGIASALGAISMWKANYATGAQYIKHVFIALNAVILTDQLTKAVMSLLPDEVSLEISEMANGVLGVVDGYPDA